MSKGIQGVHQRDPAATASPPALPRARTAAARPAIRCLLTLVSGSVALEVGFILHLYFISTAT